jgi:hypothetical protein
MKVEGMTVGVGLREMKYAAKLALSPFIIVSDCCVFTKVEKQLTIVIRKSILDNDR